MYPIEFFWRAVIRYPERPAVLSNRLAIEFGELGRLVEDRAAMIQEMAPDVDAFVAVGAQNSVDHLIAILGVLAAGKVWVPLNPRNGDPELERQVDFVRPSLILADDAMAVRLRASACPILSLDEVPPEAASRLAMGRLPSTSYSLDKTQAIKFTGGSTGAPKGVKQPLRAWTTNIVTQMHTLGLTEHDRYLVAAPLTHGTSTYMLPVLGSGGALIFPEHQSPSALLDAAEVHRATLFFAPPTLIFGLIDEQRARPRELGTMRYLVYGGAPMRPEQIRDAQTCFGKIVCTSYGQTEAPQIATFLAPEEMEGEDVLSVGRPSLFTQIAILDRDGKALPHGSEGEIAIRGDLCMTGYFDAPQATSDVLVDGWLRTGDAGVIDERGLLFLKDRLRDVIITGGFNVYPGDVEVVIAEDPAVMNCAVVGVADDKWGEAVHAAVELRRDFAFDPVRLQTAVRLALGPVKTPKEVHLFESLPRSAVGKLLKSAIRDEIVRRRSLQGDVA